MIQLVREVVRICGTPALAGLLQATITHTGPVLSFYNHSAKVMENYKKSLITEQPYRTSH